MRIKVINPNTTAGMTAKIGEAARRVAAPGTEIVAVNPAAGPVSIESHYDEAVSVLGVSLITSKGAHGIPGSAIVILAATLTAIPDLPVVGLVLILAVDWFMGIGRALTNMTGNAVAAVVIGAWENDLDRERARRVLGGQVEVSLDEAEPVPVPAATAVPAH